MLAFFVFEGKSRARTNDHRKLLRRTLTTLVSKIFIKFGRAGRFLAIE